MSLPTFTIIDGPLVAGFFFGNDMQKNDGKG